MGYIIKYAGLKRFVKQSLLVVGFIAAACVADYVITNINYELRERRGALEQIIKDGVYELKRANDFEEGKYRK